MTGYMYFTRHAHSDQEAMCEVALELSGKNTALDGVAEDLEIAFDVEQMHVTGAG